MEGSRKKITPASLKKYIGKSIGVLLTKDKETLEGLDCVWYSKKIEGTLLEIIEENKPFNRMLVININGKVQNRTINFNEITSIFAI